MTDEDIHDKSIKTGKYEHRHELETVTGEGMV